MQRVGSDHLHQWPELLWTRVDLNSFLPEHGTQSALPEPESTEPEDPEISRVEVQFL